MQKWNVKTKKYEDYTIPETWYCPIYCNDMNETINCVSCGKSMQYGDGYTSSLIHNDYGIGYSICEQCRQKENKIYIKY